MLRFEHCSWRRILAIPFLALGDIKLEAVRAGEVPLRAGHRKPHFLIGCPNIPVHPRSFEIDGAKCVKGRIFRIRIAPPTLPTILESERKRDWPGGKTEQIAVEMEIAQRQLKDAGVMQSNINPANRCRAVTAE